MLYLLLYYVVFTLTFVPQSKFIDMTTITFPATISSIGDSTGLLRKKMPLNKFFVKCLTLELPNEEKLMVNIPSMKADYIHAAFNVGDQIVATIKVVSRIWNGRMLTQLQLVSYEFVHAAPATDERVAVPVQAI